MEPPPPLPPAARGARPERSLGGLSPVEYMMT